MKRGTNLKITFFSILISYISQTSYADYGKTLFWSSVYDTSLKKSNLYAPQQEYVAGFSGYTSLAIDANNKHIYGVGPSGVYRINFDGSGLIRLLDDPGTSSYYDIALDLQRGKMYVTQRLDSKIWRANLDGSSLQEFLGPGVIWRPFGIAMDAVSAKVYWTESDTDDSPGKIRRADLDGTNIETLVETIKEVAREIELDLVEGKMYWIESYFSEIMRANLDGSMPELVLRGAFSCNGFALDLEQRRIHWGQLDGIIRSCKLDGSDVRDTLMSERGPEGLALYIPTHNIRPLTLQISGPSSVPENFQAQYIATAYLEDGNSMDVTDYSDWSVAPLPFADISNTGRLTTPDFNDAQQVTVAASYTAGGNTVDVEYLVTITDANILSVPGSYSTIQQAIDAANDGDVVVIQNGTYTGTGNRDVTFNGKAIKVKSQNGPENCIIDCQGSENDPHSGFIFNNAETRLSILEGVTIENAYAPMRRIVNWDSLSGGGIFCERSSPTIRNCIIQDNIADYCTYSNYAGGGGIFCYQGSSPHIIECTIERNTTYHKGSGIMCINSSNAVIERCAINNNSAISDFGAAVYSGGVIKECEIANNSTSGIMGHVDSVTDTIIKNNHSGYYGGGLYACRGLIKNCTIVGNTAVHKGGGTFLSTGPFINCIISNNHTGGEGGGICLYGSGGDYGLPCDLINCTMVGNTASNGDAIALYNGNTHTPHNLVIKNSVLRNGVGQIWNNNQSNVTVNYSNIEGGYPGDGNIDADPCLINPDSNNFHLLPNSPCINAGDPNFVPGPNNTDIDGDPRIMDGRVDMGADEAGDCIAQTNPDYNNWLYWGRPACWCYARQCRGDTDGLKTGPFWINLEDLKLIRKSINLLEHQIPEGGICADFDHQKLGRFWVSGNDIVILRDYISKLAADVPLCADPPDENYNFWITP